MTTTMLAFPGWDVPPPMQEPMPKMSASRRHTIERQGLLARGLNPATRKAFANNGKTCGDCSHCIGQRQAKSWYKCDRTVMTHSETTDIRIGWPACVLFEERS